MTEPSSKRGSLWQRMLDDSRLVVPTPTWFTVLRAISRSLVYGLLLLRIGLLPPHDVHAIVLWTIIGLMWVVLTTSLVIEVRHHRMQGNNWRVDVSDASFVMAPLFLLVGLPWVGLIVLVFGYVLQLRRVSGGQVFVFTLVTMGVVSVLASLALMEVESSAPTSTLTSPLAAGRYTLAMLFRLNGLTLQGPVTETGQMLMEAMQIVSALLLSALYAGLLAFLVQPADAPVATAPDPRIDQLLEQQAEILRRLDALGMQGGPEADHDGDAP